MWKLKTQLVNAGHVTVFEMLMYGVVFDWLVCRMENPPGLASGMCVRLPHMDGRTGAHAHTHTHTNTHTHTHTHRAWLFLCWLTY